MNDDLSRLYDGNLGTIVHSYYTNALGYYNHLFFYWSRFHTGSIYVKTVTFYGRHNQPRRNLYISIRCLKTNSWSTCSKEATYNEAETLRRNHVLPFHCNDDCTGIQVYNGGTGTTYSHTHPSELHIQVECPQNAGVSQSYCSL